MALSGTKTLVVDCDLASRIRTDSDPAKHQPPRGKAQGKAHRNGQAEADPTNAAGLVDVAKRRGYVPGNARQITDTNHIQTGVAAMLDGQPLDDCVIRSSVENLGIMPAGNVRAEHISRMSDTFIQNLLDEASNEYDMVLLDTGPVPGSVEALLTCSRAEGVLMVAAQGEERQHFDKALSYLKVVGATLAGTIFNRAGAQPKRKPAKASKQPQSPDASFIPQARQRPTPSQENYGSGLLAAAVFSGGSPNNGTDMDSPPAAADQTNWDLDADSVLSGMFDEGEADEKNEEDEQEPARTHENNREVHQEAIDRG